MTGNAETGINQLETLTANIKHSQYGFYNDELVFFICTITVDQQNKYESYNKLITLLASVDNSILLKTFLQAHIAAKCGHNDDAINFLKENIEYKNQNKTPLFFYKTKNISDQNAAIFS